MNFQKVQFFILLFFINLISFATSELFSATDELEKLAEIEKEILETFERFVELDEVKDDFILKKLKTWRTEYNSFKNDVSSYVSNPLNAFLLIKRLSIDVKELVKKFPKISRNDLNYKFKKFEFDAEDLTGAALGLIRLQKAYKLKSADLAEGIIDGVKTRDALTPSDLSQIAIAAINNGEAHYAVEYNKLALEKIKSDSSLSEGNVKESTQFGLIFSLEAVGEFQLALSYLSEFEESFSNNKKLVDRIREKLLAKEKKFGKKVIGEKAKNLISPELENSYKICRGEITRSAEEVKDLVCHYMSNDLFTKLAKFKVEELNKNPKILLFHNILSEEETSAIVEAAKPEKRRAETRESSLKNAKTTRVAKLAWLHEEHEVVERVSRRMKDMTGLTFNTVENLQAQVYGIGGDYPPHHDYAPPEAAPNKLGNRLATVLVYLSDVEKGGATVFSSLNLKVPVQKGSAVFWFNLEEGTSIGDPLTRHAACPVLIGTKWVANKWIREKGENLTCAKRKN